VRSGVEYDHLFSVAADDDVRVVGCDDDLAMFRLRVEESVWPTIRLSRLSSG